MSNKLTLECARIQPTTHKEREREKVLEIQLTEHRPEKQSTSTKKREIKSERQKEGESEEDDKREGQTRSIALRDRSKEQAREEKKQGRRPDEGTDEEYSVKTDEHSDTFLSKILRSQPVSVLIEYRALVHGHVAPHSPHGAARVI